MSELARQLIAANKAQHQRGDEAAKRLDLGNCGLTELPEELFDLHWLEELVVSNEWFDRKKGKWHPSANNGAENRLVNLPAGIRKLRNLKILVLEADDWGEWQIRDYIFLSKLTGLQSLSLRNNKISDIDFLSKMTGLQSLSLSNSWISDISFLSKLRGLQSLYLRDNKISGISFLSKLTGLQSLYLRDNKISDYSFLSNLTSLQSLYLRGNNISDYSFLSNLRGLQSLYLGGNNISDISFLSNLRGLQSLDLSENNISDISILSKLRGLQSLYLRDNLIREFPIFLLNYSHLQDLYLKGNPIAGVPAEIIEEWDSLVGVRNYFQSLARGGTPNNEVKLLLLGNGRVGKTSLVRAMLDRTFSEQVDSTDKILLRIWEMVGVKPDVLKENPLKVNIWDFGGQEIYYTTHRLFLRTRALFLLVWDKETEEAFAHEDGYGHTFENFKLPHWIDYIRTAAQSPVIVVQNKVDRRGDRYTVYEELLCSLYDKIVDFQYVSAKNDYQTGLTGLQNSIRLAYEELPTVGQLIPAQWMSVKERLRSLREKRSISHAEYVSLCLEEGLKGTEHETLLYFLHDSGFLDFLEDIKDPRLILDQQWAIDAIYTVLTRSNNCYRDFCRLNRHGFTLVDLDRLVWGEKYSSEEQKELLRFMVSTEICFEFAEGVYIAPQLLIPERPPRVKCRREWCDPQGSALKFRYQFLHSAIIERFIVRAGRMVNEKDDDPIIWRNGIAIYDEKSNTDALVEAFPRDKEIRVLTHGDRPMDLIKKIMEELASLNSDYEPEILFSVDGGSHFVKRQDAERFYRARAETVPDENGNFVELELFRPFLQLEERESFDEQLEKGLPRTALKSKRMEPEKPVIRCFISYAHFYDEYFQVFRDDFDTQVANLPFAQLDIWTDEKIPLGAGWHERIQQQVASCDLAILLVSDRLMTSEYIKEHEVALLLEQQGAGKTLVVPVYFYPCRFYDWPELAKNQFFKPKGADYGRADRDKKNRFCYADLVEFEDLQGGVKIAKNNTYRSDYMMDFVEALEDQLREMAKEKSC